LPSLFTKLALIGMIPLLILMVNPAYAIMTSFTLEKDIYTDEESIVFVGTESEGHKMISVALYNPNGKFVNMLGDPSSDLDGSFATTPKRVEDLFTTTGRYNATGFIDKISEGITIFLNYDGNRVSIIPNFVLDLIKIGNKSVTEKQPLSFTASVTDSSLKDLVFKLDKNPPTGATIDSKTGVFSWTPTEAQGPGTYLFDIVVSKGPLEDRETITVTVDTVSSPPSSSEPEPASKIPDFVDPKKGAQYYLDRYNDEPAYKKWFDSNFPDYTIEEAIELAIPDAFSEPEPASKIPDFVDPKKGAQYYLDRYNDEPAYKKWFDSNFPDYTIEEAIELAIPDAFSEPEPASKIPDFVDPKKGAQYYLDRYNDEPAYKKWFDSNFPDYTIEEAIELAIPDAFSEPEPEKKIAPFVDPDEDPQYYIDRYNNEPTYKAWFDENFPDQTIYEAVGVEAPKTGICGTGTHFEDGTCVIDNQGGGCLIATAAYDSEMSQQVQLLRELRDNTVLGTDSGSSFMNTFNSIYYSFSPTIADWERQSPIFKNAVRIAITPLLTSLSILNTVDIDSEEEMLGYGIGIILLNLGMYLVGPVFAVVNVRKYFIK